MTDLVQDRRGAVTRWLVDRIAEELKRPPADLPTDCAFFDLGLNSLNTLVIVGELGDFLERDDLSPSLFWDYPSINRLARHLDEAEASAAE